MAGPAGSKPAGTGGLAVTAPDMAGDTRHVYGPRPLGALVPAITRPAYRRRSPATAQMMADWEAVVGPALAGVTVPRRFSAGSLTIACAGPVAMELQHLAGELIARINTHLGTKTVQALRFVQTAAPPPPTSPATKEPHPAVAQAADAAVAGLPEGELRDALGSLGRAGLAAGRLPLSVPGGRAAEPPQQVIAAGAFHGARLKHALPGSAVRLLDQVKQALSPAKPPVPNGAQQNSRVLLPEDILDRLVPPQSLLNPWHPSLHKKTPQITQSRCGTQPCDRSILFNLWQGMEAAHRPLEPVVHKAAWP